MCSIDIDRRESFPFPVFIQPDDSHVCDVCKHTVTHLSIESLTYMTHVCQN